MATSPQYTRRRIIAALTIVVIAVGLYLLLRYLLAGGPDPSSSPVSPSPTPTPTDTPEPSPTPTPTADAAPGPCAPEALHVTLTADAESYIIGQAQPTFQVTITNVGDVICLADGGTAAVALMVLSGEDRVWNSMDCTANAVSRPLLMEPGISDDRFTDTWNLHRSTEGCPDPGAEPVVGPGTYTVTATVGGTSSPAVVFTLQEPPPPPEPPAEEPPAEAPPAEEPPAEEPPAEG